MREEKKMIRKKLHDFEDNFFRQNGRYVCVSLSLISSFHMASPDSVPSEECFQSGTLATFSL
jgi:hypothetical protein